MAHPCFDCGGECYCSGDIDDAIISKTPASCEGCGCSEDDDTDPEMDPVGWECCSCMLGPFDYPGPCPICENPLEPYG